MSLDMWKRKLAFLQGRLAEASNPAQQFELNEQIEEAKQKIAELEGGTSSLPQLLHQIPEPPADFTGRQSELNELRDGMARGGVAISGLSGMGAWARRRWRCNWPPS
jgi:hypothetical protein